MAALSVQKARGGKMARIPWALAAVVSADRSPRLAATPPPTAMVVSPASVAAAIARFTNAFTTAVWKLAARSATGSGASGRSRCHRSTA